MNNQPVDDVDPPRQRFCFWMRNLEILRWVNGNVPGGIKAGMVYMVAMVGFFEKRDVCISEIANLTELDRKSVRRYARGLVEAGWGHLESSADCTCLVIKATPANHAWRETMDDMMQRCMDTASSNFGERAIMQQC